MRLPIDAESVEIKDVKTYQPGLNGGNGDASLLVSVEQAASILGIGRTRTFELVMAQKITSVKIGRRRLVIRRSLEEFIQRLVAAQESSGDQ
jgi:excisionase family DNA binding protein